MTERVMVSTPRGAKYHGTIDGDEFIREVDYDKDRMKIFDAWSIHPEAYQKCLDQNVQTLVYLEPKLKKVWRVSFSDLQKMVTGEIVDHKQRKLAWFGEFAGGKTLYIKLEAFNGEYKQHAIEQTEAEKVKEQYGAALKQFKPEFGNPKHLEIQQIMIELQKAKEKDTPRLMKQVIWLLKKG